jgi:benzoylsuccinyl-CoA thiolase BbsB subunit
MSRRVFVVGAGMIPFGRYENKMIADLGKEAIDKALKDAKLEWKQIEAAFCGHVHQGMTAGQRVCSSLGYTGIPIFNFENACASGSSAFVQAFNSIAMGQHDMVVVCGFEKMKKGAVTVDEDGKLKSSKDKNIFAMGYAMVAKEHMRRFGTTEEQIAMVSVKNHRYGAMNPYAQYRKEVSLKEVMSSRPIAPPLKLLECCPTSDGAAAVILASEEVANRLDTNPIYVASAVLTSLLPVSDPLMAIHTMTENTAKKAYGIAMTKPSEIDVAEVHDCFSIAELIHYEGLGFCRQGEGGRMIQEGRTEIGGDITVSVSGGLLSKGHPLGATGVAQVCELVWQLRGDAGRRQVKGATTALAHCQGFGGATTVIVLKGGK